MATKQVHRLWPLTFLLTAFMTLVFEKLSAADHPCGLSLNLRPIPRWRRRPQVTLVASITAMARDAIFFSVDLVACVSQ